MVKGIKLGNLLLHKTVPPLHVLPATFSRFFDTCSEIIILGSNFFLFSISFYFSGQQILLPDYTMFARVFFRFLGICYRLWIKCAGVFKGAFSKCRASRKLMKVDYYRQSGSVPKWQIRKFFLEPFFEKLDHSEKLLRVS